MPVCSVLELLLLPHCTTVSQSQYAATRQHALGRQLALERVPDRVVLRLIAAAADAARRRRRDRRSTRYVRVYASTLRTVRKVLCVRMRERVLGGKPGHKT